MVPPQKGTHMMIFQRMVTFQGPPDEIGAWALEITEAVNTRTQLATTLWQGTFGVPVGSLAWSAIVDNLTALEAANDALLGDAGYLSLVAKAAPWATTAPQDSWLQTIHTSGGEFVRARVGSYSENIMAIPAPGKLAAAGVFGVEMADLHTQLTHAPVLFCSSAYGAFGELRWLAMYESAAAVDTAAELVAKDEEYGAKLDAAGDLFVAGMARRVLARRIA
ncbi:MAG TPA: hypothetical protein VHC63_10135 [Acidimicrobiales bacterium]|nr:hypothetical protein [Acidimicrobiales bacterium]